MATNETVTRVYREAVASYGVDGVNKLEAEESAIATLLVEVEAGRLDIDLERALRAEIRRADAADGRSADGLLRRLAEGDVPLLAEDLDVVVTLGGGHRKTWDQVTAADLETMNQIRFANYKAARESFQEFNGNVLRVVPVLAQFATLGDAFWAGAFDAPEAVA